MAETDSLEDAYRFRTPSLRNVELTAPYGHNGAYPTLEGIIRHHVAPRAALDLWSPEMARLATVPSIEAIDFVAFRNAREGERLGRAIDVSDAKITDEEVDALVAFLKTLTGTESIKGRLGSPSVVPSGLPVDQP